VLTSAASTPGDGVAIEADEQDVSAADMWVVNPRSPMEPKRMKRHRYFHVGRFFITEESPATDVSRDREAPP
jgi:hypothetical protein